MPEPFGACFRWEAEAIARFDHVQGGPCLELHPDGANLAEELAHRRAVDAYFLEAGGVFGMSVVSLPPARMTAADPTVGGAEGP